MDIRTEIANIDNDSVRAILEELVPNEYMRPEESAVLLALTGDEVCGFLLFRNDKACIEITFLYVFEEYRRQGVATYLLDSFGLMLWSEQYHYPVLMYIPDNEDLIPLIALMKDRLDYQVDHASTCVRVTYDQIGDSKTLQKLLATKKKPMSPLFDVPGVVRKKEYQNNKETHKYIGEGLVSDGKNYCTDLCLCGIADEKIRGFILVRKWDDKTLNLEYMYSKDEKVTAALIAGLGEKIIKNYKGFSLTVSAVNDISKKLLEKFFEDQTVHSQYRAWWNGLVWSEIEELV